MAGILIVGAIPSGCAGAVTSVNGLYAVRFFIGILGVRQIFPPASQFFPELTRFAP